MIPEALKSRTQWLVWRYESHAGDKKPRKMPYYANGARRTGKQGDEADRGKLTTFDFALEAKTRGKYDGVGFAFLPGDGLIGIDLDNMIDAASGEISERGRNILSACASFAEYSPSRRGLHIYALGATDSFKSNDIGVEVFCGRQFFTVTGEHYPGTPEAVTAIDSKVLGRLRTTVDQAKGKRRGGVKPGGPVTDQRVKVESALAVLSAECGYEEWVEIGMAIHAELGDAGFSVWDYWSGKSAKYPGARELETHWRSFKPGGGITGATLFKRAKDAGWRPPRSSGGKCTPPAAGGAAAPPSDGTPPADAGDAGEGLPVIQWKAGELPRVVDDAEAALLAADERIFQRDRMLVRVIRRSSHTVRKYKSRPGTLSIMMIDTPYLVEAFTRTARWEKYDSRLDKWRRINAPEQAASTYLSRAGKWKLPRLASVIAAPTLRPDGTTLQKPGYDEPTRCWYDPCGVEFPLVPDKPTREEAETALALLIKWLSTFPFEAEMDRSVALALALCALVRRSLPAAPLGAISAPVMASGKTLLADCIAILATGASAPTMAFAKTDEEAQKTALAVLLEGDAVVLIDNVERPLEGDWLCSILTSESYNQRVLGRSEMVRVPTNTQILATGNHLVIVGDLRTRSLLCRLDPKVEHPEERKFERDLREWMVEHRPALVVAGLTVMRAFIAQGVDTRDYIQPWGRFERYSDMVRAPLVWLGQQDPCASIKALEDEDPQRIEHLRLMHHWLDVFKERAVTAREAVEQAHTNSLVAASSSSPLQEVFMDIALDRAGQVSSRRLGKWLQRFSGRRAKGRQIVKHGEMDHVALWKVEVITTG